MRNVTRQQSHETPIRRTRWNHCATVLNLRSRTRPAPAQLAQHLLSPGRVGPTPGRHLPNSAELHPTFGQHRPTAVNLAQHRPNVVRGRASWAGKHDTCLAITAVRRCPHPGGRPRPLEFVGVCLTWGHRSSIAAIGGGGQGVGVKRQVGLF